MLNSNELVMITKDNQIKTSSRKVAEVFEKRHHHVLRDIENIISSCSQDFTKTNYGLSYYKDNTGKSNKEYLITKDGLVMLVMGYTTQKAMKFKEAYINAFNQMALELEKQAQNKLHLAKIRQELKLENVEMTDALKDFRMDKGKDTQSHHYINEYNLINRLVLGMDTKKYKEKNNIPNSANLRDYLMPVQIDLIMKLQKANTTYIDEGLEYDERKAKLTKIFESKYKSKLLH